MHHPSRPALRGLLCLFAIVALLGACGDDDDDEAGDDTTTTEEETTTTEEETTTTKAEKETTTTEADGGDACSRLDPEVIEDAMGFPFEERQSTATSCLFQAEDGSAVALNLADVSSDPKAGLAGAKTTCEVGSAEDIEAVGTDGAFTCLVMSGGQSIPTVAGVIGGDLVVITGAFADTSVSTDTIIAALVEILES